MIIDTDFETTKTLSREHGFGTIELLIVVAVIGIASTFAFISFRTSRASLAVQNSVRQLASYMEKARIDAVRRHSTAVVRFTSPTSYTVTMDFLNDGTTTDRSFNFDNGVQLASSELPNVTFNWRGRTLTSGTSCVTTFSVRNDSNPNDGLNVDVSGSGDVTVENQSPTLPNVPYNNTIPASSSVKTATVVSGPTLVDSTPCLDVSGEGIGGQTGPPLCTIRISSTSVSVKKNGGGSANEVVGMSTPSAVVASYPSNLTVTPAYQSVSTGSSFLIKSNNNLRGPFTVTFSAQCGTSISATVNVTN